MSADASNYDLKNVECQRLLRLRNLIETTKVRKASNFESWWRFKAEFPSPAISACVCFDSQPRHNAYRQPGLRNFRIPSHFVAASQWDGNPAFTMHAVSHPFKVRKCAVPSGHLRSEISFSRTCNIQNLVSHYSHSLVTRGVVGRERRSHTLFTFCFKMSLKLF